ncbi:hypothetical protein DRV85_14945 [Rhodosalinus halophilus]|uniref:Alpha/beta hydrolase family protein n=1 Tax=Rhodosalinus halophilus TaxID=2259333 RepID=A0A365U5H1_9RHOB|nr:alpha/beta hydrolase [Rhodosalinus halophilus]RBI83639.1 hypothetical protein DRV85_14945 [Rhodosalinus halophilus]
MVRRALAEGRPERGARRFVTCWGGEAPWAARSDKARWRVAAELAQGLAGFAALAAEPHRPSRAAAPGCPVLLLHGGLSHNPARLAAKRLATLPPRCAVAELAGAPHMGPLSHPDRVAAAIARHIPGTAGPSEPGPAPRAGSPAEALNDTEIARKMRPRSASRLCPG